MQAKADQATGLVYKDMITNHREIFNTAAGYKGSSESSTQEEYVGEWRAKTGLKFKNHLTWLRAARDVLEDTAVSKEEQASKKRMRRGIEEQISEVELASHKHELAGLTLDEDVFKNSTMANSIHNAVSSNALASAFDVISNAFLDFQSPLVNRTLDRHFESKASGAERDSGKQSDMRRDMVDAYGCERAATWADMQHRSEQKKPKDKDKSTKSTMVWDPVVQKWFDHGEIKCAHIMPLSIGPEIAAYILGRKPEEGKAVLFSASNAIPLCTTLEGLFDSHNAVIMPYAIKGGVYQFKFVILDQAIMGNKFRHSASGVWIYLKDLHDRPLKFMNDFRPAKRNLFWHFAHTLERRRLSGVTDWHLDAQKITLRAKDGKKVNITHMWASPGGYVKRSVLAHLAQRWGYGGAPKDFREWLASHGLDEGKDDADENELLGKAVGPLADLAALDREEMSRERND